MRPLPEFTKDQLREKLTSEVKLQESYSKAAVEHLPGGTLTARDIFHSSLHPIVKEMFMWAMLDEQTARILWPTVTHGDDFKPYGSRCFEGATGLHTTAPAWQQVLFG